MNELALFAGAGGGILGGKLLGWRTVCAVEIDSYAREVIAARQNDGCLDPFPIWDDVRTFDGRPWRGIVDVVSGGFPCQDISVAGKGAGIGGERSGLWREFARIIREIRPRFVLVENSPALTGRGLGTVLGDLAAMGFDARWGVLGAVHAGAPHKRERIWIVADAVRDGAGEGFGGVSGEAGPNQEGARRRSWAESGDGGADVRNAASKRFQDGRGAQVDGSSPESKSERSGGDVPNADCAGREEQWSAIANGAKHETAECSGWWRAEPDVGRVAHGVANRVDRLRCIGNGQVPAVVKLAWGILSGAGGI